MKCNESHSVFDQTVADNGAQHFFFFLSDHIHKWDACMCVCGFTFAFVWFLIHKNIILNKIIHTLRCQQLDFFSCLPIFFTSVIVCDGVGELWAQFDLWWYIFVYIFKNIKIGESSIWIWILVCSKKKKKKYIVCFLMKILMTRILFNWWSHENWFIKIIVIVDDPEWKNWFRRWWQR